MYRVACPIQENELDIILFLLQIIKIKNEIKGGGGLHPMGNYPRPHPLPSRLIKPQIIPWIPE